jgi:hypothetical protein
MVSPAPFVQTCICFGEFPIIFGRSFEGDIAFHIVLRESTQLRVVERNCFEFELRIPVFANCRNKPEFKNSVTLIESGIASGSADAGLRH